ncbi:protein kinase [Streptomyces europaeiscabiei]|uniref:protein kinase domain-containing protein n=1 Tax=Streptomyces europaeiscabiei TaxID=146819 RepID=UPI0029AAC90F|nr:protein kinase [Streptomyces europaeiscabiei]MDX3694945.1 protein kinase [Streptomyces europaeiscabiei]
MITARRVLLWATIAPPGVVPGRHDARGGSMEDVRELLAEYGQCHSDEVPEQDRHRLLVDVVAALIRRTDAEVTVDYRSPDEPAVFFELAGRDYAISVTAASGTDVAESARAAVQGLEQRNLGPGVRWVLVCARTTGGAVDDALRAVLGARGVLLDRDHVEAAVCALAPLSTLIRSAFRTPRPPYTPLHELLLQEPAEPAPALSLLARPSGPVTVPARAEPGIEASVVLAGEAWPLTPSGLAWESAERALITTEAGLAEVDLLRGGVRWRLPLPGVHGAAVVLPDGAVCVACGPSVVMWRGGELRAVGGGFETVGSLLLGPDASVWVLSGSGATFGAGTGSTLALTRIGEEVGDQQRFSIAFDAAVRSAGWLDGRRFFLAASGHSAVVDLAVGTSAGGREDWTLTPVSYPGHLACTGSDTVLVAGRAGSGIGVELHNVNAASRTSEAVVELQLGDVLGLAQNPAGGPAYLLGSLPTNDIGTVHPVLMKITGHAPAATPAVDQPQAPAPAADPYAAVRLQARGVKKDYALDIFPMPGGEGGMGVVHEAVHKATGTVVAFKKPRSLREKLTARMLREIEVAQKLGGNRHVMPVLDSSPRAEWFVMPMAQNTAERLQPQLQGDAQELRALVDAVAAALADAHHLDYLHRDIKPANILHLDGRWVLGDWGIVRRPRGQTTNPKRTGTSIGTAEFGAPELFVDPHNATPASDIYSLGKVIGWLLTGIDPQPNVVLLPSGPWRGVVRQCTFHEASQRPQTIAEFLDLVERETSPALELPIARAQQLAAAAQEGDTDAAGRLLALAADNGGDYELYLDVLPGLEMDLTGPLLLANAEQALTLVRAMAGHVQGDGTGWPHYNECKRAIAWLRGVARQAAQEEEWDLLEEAARGMCTWDAASNEFDQQIATRDWLRRLRGQAAQILAGVLREHPGSARYYYELAGERAVDLNIRSAIKSATSN